MPAPTDKPTKLSLIDLHVGQRFTSDSHTFTTEEIISFAKLYDPQPFHTDEVAAKSSVFGSLVASGWHSSCISMRLIVESVHLDCGLVGLGGTIVWLKPVHPGNSIHVESEIAEITHSRSKPGQAVVMMQCKVKNEANETVIEFTPKLMVFGSAA